MSIENSYTRITWSSTDVAYGKKWTKLRGRRRIKEFRSYYPLHGTLSFFAYYLPSHYRLYLFCATFESFIPFLSTYGGFRGYWIGFKKHILRSTSLGQPLAQKGNLIRRHIYYKMVVWYSYFMCLYVLYWFKSKTNWSNLIF